MYLSPTLFSLFALPSDLSACASWWTLYGHPRQFLQPTVLATLTTELDKDFVLIPLITRETVRTIIYEDNDIWFRD